MAAQSVLIVEDEENLRVALQFNLQQEGYDVHTAPDGLTGLDVARTAHPDLLILDVMLPGMNGYDLCREVRKDSDVPILMLTAKSEEFDKVVGLELGADDYVTKPFSVRELIARVHALLRRRRIESQSPGLGASLRAGDLSVDIAGHVVRQGSDVVELKPREFDLLALFVANPGRAYSRAQILEAVWGYNYIGDERTVDVHIRWLRQKIEVEPSTPRRIVTVRGLGYRFEG
jgi:two-component system, OmpR family, response regulator